MTTLAALEAAVQRKRDPDTLAVYADALLAVGDPRGELVALDLELARRGHDTALLDRKRQLLAAWIGDRVGQQPWHPRNFEYGVFSGLGIANTQDRAAAEYVQAVLASPLGNRLDRISIYGNRNDLTRSLEVLTEATVPWLRRLSLQRHEPKRVREKPLDRAVWDRFVAAAPHLEDLTLIGTGVVASPLHPNLHTLRLPDGLGLAISSPEPNVTTIELGFRGPNDYEALAPERAIELVGAVNPRAFPGLRTLDLARNEGAPYVDNSGVTPPPGVYAPNQPAILGPAIDAIERLDRFERLRLPSLADEASARYVLGLAERHPQLSIEIARMYTTLGVSHPRVHIPASRVWPQSPHSRDALTIDVPGEQYGDELALSSIVGDLEDQFDAMPADAQQAWVEFWEFLDDLPWEDDQGNTVTEELSAATLLRALEALDGNGRGDTVAELIRKQNLPPDARVRVTRYWGW